MGYSVTVPTHTVDESTYENDEVMAQLGRDLLDQYLGWCNLYRRPQGQRGWASYAQVTLENYIEDREEEEEVA